MHKAFYLNSL